MDDLPAAANHGASIENQRGIVAGQFRSKRGNLDLRHTWPLNYRARDKRLREPEREGTETPDENEPASVNVRNADYIAYGAVFLAWIAVLAWASPRLSECCGQT